MIADVFCLTVNEELRRAYCVCAHVCVRMRVCVTHLHFMLWVIRSTEEKSEHLLNNKKEAAFMNQQTIKKRLLLCALFTPGSN